MKVFGYPGSSCTRKVLLTLNEKHQAYDFINVDLAKGEQKSAEHLLRHPFGVVPVIDDDGYIMYESRAIIRYLDARFPGISLTPADTHDYGRMEQWIGVEQSYFSTPVLQIISESLWGPKQGKEPNTAVIAHAQKQVEHVLDIIEPVLEQQRYLAGKEYSLADIAWIPSMQFLEDAGQNDLIHKRPHVAKWWESVSTRPTWEKATAA